MNFDKKNSVCIKINNKFSFDWKIEFVELTLIITNKIIAIWVIVDFNVYWNRVAAKRFMLIYIYIYSLSNAMEFDHFV